MSISSDNNKEVELGTGAQNNHDTSAFDNNNEEPGENLGSN
jgi:hypothetical protein